MKTAISVPDEIFESADALAGKLHVTRSKLYSMALEQFIKENEKENITQKINEYIEKYGQPVDQAFLDFGLREMREMTKNDTW
jgi:hypothetical protein